MYLTTRGLVLRTTEYKETDRILTILTDHDGLLSVKARGVRSNRSKLKGACQLLTYAEFTISDARGFTAITEATAIEMFPELRNDLLLLSLASYFAQLAEVLSQEDASSPALLSLILNALYALSKLKKPPRLVKAATELRLAAIAGYMPELSYGSHMFQDLVEAGSFYVALYAGEDDCVFQDTLFADCENVYAQLMPSDAEDVMADVIRVYDLGKDQAILYSEVGSQTCFLAKV